jgi:hypothetical protein
MQWSEATMSTHGPTTEARSAIEVGPAGGYAVAAGHTNDQETAELLAEQVFILTGRHI